MKNNQMEEQLTNPLPVRKTVPDKRALQQRQWKVVIRLWKIFGGVLGALIILQFFWQWLSRMMPNVYGFGAVLVFLLITFTINVHNVRQRSSIPHETSGTDSMVYKSRVTFRPTFLFLGWTLILFFGGLVVFLVVDDVIHPNTSNIGASAGIAFGVLLVVIGMMLVGAFRKKKD